MVCYLQLAHSVRHPDTGVPTATVIHNFGRAELVDRAALARLVASTSRFLDPSRRSPPPGTAKWRCSPPPTAASRNATQRNTSTANQKTILAALDLPEPPKYLDVTPGTDAVTD